MKIFNQPAIALAFIHRDAGTKKNGETYNAFNIFNYIVEGDETSRSLFLQDDTNPLLKELKAIAEIWGTEFEFSGNIDGRGNITMESVKKIV